MRQAETLAGVRMIKFMSVSGRWEAAELRGMSERTFRRSPARWQKMGPLTGITQRQDGSREKSAALAPVPGANPAEILWVQEERRVSGDNFVSFNRVNRTS